MSFGFFRNLDSTAAKPAPRPAELREHQVAGRTLPLRIVENARARRLTLRIDPGGQGLRITVPPGLRRSEIEKFLDRHRGWLEEKLAKVPDRPQMRPGVKLPLYGVPHPIVHEPGRRGTAAVRESEAGPVLVVHGEEAHLPRRVADFLKREARREIALLVEKHTAAIGRKAKAVRFKDTSSRWGSCTADGTLSFSWRIMMAPRPVIDYLVAHEVAHLREMNHGPKFWKLCEQLCPDTPRCKAWLKRNGPALQAIAFE